MKKLFIKVNNMKHKKVLVKIVSAVTASVFLFTNTVAFASILGEQTSHNQTEYAQGTTYNRNTFYNDSVGQQTENYFEYIPNGDVLPIVSNGSQVYGKRNVDEANKYLEEQGVFAAMGMNADFFSFQTGVPMSNTIVDGQVLTADDEYTTGVGFNADGTGFVAPMQIQITATTQEGTTFGIECLNKYRQPYVMYLYTSDFGSYTNASGNGTNIVFGNVNGNFTLGQPVSATVESIFSDNGSVQIPDGKLVLSIDDAVAWEVKARLDSLYEGQTITFTANEVSGETRWASAEYGTGCLGGTLIRNGQLDYVDDSAAPRSAVGIKADGTIIFYTIDGRQPGYSYGVRKETLARRLLELGCVDAVNLDGGGSTQLGGVPPETTELQILNSPSEGLRKCANFIFLKKMNAPDGIPYKLLVYPYAPNVLSGSQVGIWASAIDASYGKATITEPLVYSIESDKTTSGQAAINNDGYLTVYGDGQVYVAAQSGAAQGSTMVNSVSNPDNIVVMNAENNAEISSITLAADQSINLTADAIYQGEKLVDSESAYKWELSDSSLGTIHENGIFIANNINASGELYVSVGSKVVSIPVTIGAEAQPSSAPSETDYPTIMTSNSDTMFTAKINGSKDSIDSSDITFKIDGKTVDFSYSAEEQTLTYLFSDGFIDTPHEIVVSVTDKSGYSAFKVHQVGDMSLLANSFADTDNHWAKDYISYMTLRGVVSGYEIDNNEVFMPDNKMTRAEFACMIANYLNINLFNYRGVELPYSDKDQIPEWAMMQVQAMYELRIMTGQQNGDKIEFAPTSNIKRSEYSVAVSRLMPKGLYSSPINAIDVTDIPAWAVSGVELLLTQGVMNGYTDGYIRPNNNVTRAEAIKILYGIG